MARSCCFGQQQDNQSSHLKIVLAVIDEASAKRRQQIIELDSHDVGVKYNHNRREIIKEKYINSYQIIKMYVLTLTSCINQFSIDVLLSEFATCLAHFYIHQLHRSSVLFLLKICFLWLLLESDIYFFDYMHTFNVDFGEEYLVCAHLFMGLIYFQQQECFLLMFAQDEEMHRSSDPMQSAGFLYNQRSRSSKPMKVHKGPRNRH